jgi:transcriptional regulator with XRE-family HTH domain
MTDTTLGQRIAERRKLLGLSQESFGEKMGVSRQAISKWEADTSTPEVEKLITMSKLFGVSVDWLLGTEEEEEPFQIAAAFRMPRPEPVTPPPAPEPEPEIAEPEPEPPAEEQEAKKPHLNWLNIVCVALAAISLVLSIVSMNFRPETVVPTSDAERISQLEKQITDVNKKYNENDQFLMQMVQLQHELREDMRKLQQEMDAALKVIENSGKPVEPPKDTLPTYNGLTDWSMKAQLADDLEHVTVTFSGTPSENLKGIRFLAKVGEETTEADCRLSDGVYTTELHVKPAEGYQYMLKLEHTDSTVERITLEGHGLSNLLKPSIIAMELVEWEDSIFNDTHTKTAFVIGWQMAFLQAPSFTPEDAQCTWSNVRIGYYHNEELLEEKILAEDPSLANMDWNKQMVNFQVPSFTYKLPYLLDGDRHELRMEGTLIIDGVAKDFSFPMAKWVIEQQKMVRQ